ADPLCGGLVIIERIQVVACDHAVTFAVLFSARFKDGADRRMAFLQAGREKTKLRFPFVAAPVEFKRQTIWFGAPSRWRLDAQCSLGRAREIARYRDFHS